MVIQPTESDIGRRVVSKSKFEKSTRGVLAGIGDFGHPETQTFAEVIFDGTHWKIAVNFSYLSWELCSYFAQIMKEWAIDE